jgi:uncharacterized membrane protein YheB (UPF0754 family)
MKTIFALFTALALCSLVITGCGKQENSTTSNESTPAAINTAKVESEFAAAESSVKEQLNKAMADIKATNYSEAMQKLKTLTSEVKLTPQQQAAVKELLTQLQAKASSALKDAGEAITKGATSTADTVSNAATKAVSDLKDTFKK